MNFALGFDEIYKKDEKISEKFLSFFLKKGLSFRLLDRYRCRKIKNATFVFKMLHFSFYKIISL